MLFLGEPGRSTLPPLLPNVPTPCPCHWWAFGGQLEGEHVEPERWPWSWPCGRSAARLPRLLSHPCLANHPLVRGDTRWRGGTTGGRLLRAPHTPPAPPLTPRGCKWSPRVYKPHQSCTLRHTTPPALPPHLTKSQPSSRSLRARGSSLSSAGCGDPLDDCHPVSPLSFTIFLFRASPCDEGDDWHPCLLVNLAEGLHPARPLPGPTSSSAVAPSPAVASVAPVASQARPQPPASSPSLRHPPTPTLGELTPTPSFGRHFFCTHTSSRGGRRSWAVDFLIHGSVWNPPDLFLAVGSRSGGGLPIHSRARRRGPAQCCWPTDRVDPARVSFFSQV